jgi:hypothetical protein
LRIDFANKSPDQSLSDFIIVGTQFSGDDSGSDHDT